jgi:hypothetical protein
LDSFILKMRALQSFETHLIICNYRFWIRGRCNPSKPGQLLSDSLGLTSQKISNFMLRYLVRCNNPDACYQFSFIISITVKEYGEYVLGVKVILTCLSLVWLKMCPGAPLLHHVKCLTVLSIPNNLVMCQLNLILQLPTSKSWKSNRRFLRYCVQTAGCSERL